MPRGMDYEKKSFTVMSDNVPVLNVMSDADREALRVLPVHEISDAREYKPKRKMLVPCGERILVKRQSIGGKLGSGILHAPADTADRPTEIAEVLYIPELSAIDKSLIENSSQITEALAIKCKSGDSEALNSLMEFNRYWNDYLRYRLLKVGAKIMISRYAGTDMLIQETNQFLTLIDFNGIVSLVVENE